MNLKTWVSVLGVRLEFGWERPIRTETSDKKPVSGFSMTPPVYASEIEVRVYGFGYFFLGASRPLRHRKNILVLLSFGAPQMVS